MNRRTSVSTTSQKWDRNPDGTLRARARAQRIDRNEYHLYAIAPYAPRQGRRPLFERIYDRLLGI